jgi:hypothetical protein
MQYVNYNGGKAFAVLQAKNGQDISNEAYC